MAQQTELMFKHRETGELWTHSRIEHEAEDSLGASENKQHGAYHARGNESYSSPCPWCEIIETEIDAMMADFDYVGRQ